MTNSNLPPVETDLKFVGDQITICQIIQLLAYIRNSLESDTAKKIVVSIGKNVKSKNSFTFTVNNEQIRDYVAKDFIEIN